jgi:acyl carrier protein
MEIQDFIDKLEVELDDIEPGTLSPNSRFREMENWSSMYALILIAFTDVEYNVSLNGDDLRHAQTIQDIFDIVKAKMNA